MRDNTKNIVNSGAELLEMDFTIVKPKWSENGSPFGHISARFYGLKQALHIGDYYTSPYIYPRDGHESDIFEFFQFRTKNDIHAIGYNGIPYQKGEALNDHLTSGDCESGKLECVSGEKQVISIDEFINLTKSLKRDDGTEYKLLSHNCADVLISAANEMRPNMAEKLMEDIDFTDWGVGSYIDYKYHENTPERILSAGLTGVVGGSVLGAVVGLSTYGVARSLNEPEALSRSVTGGLRSVATMGPMVAGFLTYSTGIPETSAMMMVSILAASYLMKRFCHDRENPYARMEQEESSIELPSFITDALVTSEFHPQSEISGWQTLIGSTSQAQSGYEAL